MDAVSKAISGRGWVGLDISEWVEESSTFGTNNNIISERREHLDNNDISVREGWAN